VPEFHLLYLNGSRLSRSETLEAEDALSAVHIAATRPHYDVLELWSSYGQVAIFKPVGSGHLRMRASRS
jgi:hypothetical protein